jgi:hypothetical protein
MQQLEYTIHELLSEVQAIRPITLNTLYRWLREDVGAGRIYYSVAELEKLKQKARNLNNQRTYRNYASRLTQQRTINYEAL